MMQLMITSAHSYHDAIYDNDDNDDDDAIYGDDDDDEL